MKKQVAVITVAGLSLAACGGDASESSSETEAQPTETETETEAQPTETETLPDAVELTEEADAQGVSALSLAFDQASETVSYRAEMAMGMNMSMAELGQSISFEADPATPMVFVEVDADGEQYARMDLAPMMNALMSQAGAGADASEVLGGGDLSMEFWQDADVLIMDVGGFGPLLEQNLGAANPFPADVFTVDLEQLSGSIDGVDVASAFSGQTAPDPVEMAEVLREVLGESAVADASGDRFSGTITFLDYARAFGQDPDDMFGGMDASFEQMGMDAEAFASIFDDITADVEVALDDGAVDTVRFDVDLSPMFDGLMNALSSDPSMTEADEDEMRSVIENMSFEMTMLMNYDIDVAVDVQIPEGDLPDATDEFVDIFEAVGAN